MSDRQKGAPAKRSRGRAIAGIIGGVVGLWLGFLILNLTGELTDLGAGEKALRIVFGIVWFTFFVGVMVYNVLNLSSISRAKREGERPGPREVEAIPPGSGEAARTDFEARLRKLESLRKDGLLSEEEYRKKREEFIGDKW